MVDQRPEKEDHLFTGTKMETNEDVPHALPDTVDVSQGQYDHSQHFRLVVMYQSIILYTIFVFHYCSCPLDLNLKGFNPLLQCQFQLPFMCCSHHYFGTGIAPRICISDLDTKIWEIGRKTAET